MHLCRCYIVFKPLFHQNVHSLFPCNLFAAEEDKGETTHTTGVDKITVATTKPRQTLDEIHIQQTVSTVRDR